MKPRINHKCDSSLDVVSDANSDSHLQSTFSESSEESECRMCKNKPKLWLLKVYTNQDHFKKGTSTQCKEFLGISYNNILILCQFHRKVCNYFCNCTGRKASDWIQSYKPCKV